MRSFKRIALLIAFIGSFILPATAQSVLDPADPIVTYNPSFPPSEPAFGQIGKWVRTIRLGWNTSSYKAYIYKGVPFRLKFPKTYNPTAVDGKKYPMMVFFHGLGETGPITDNEFQLYHGGEFFKNSVDNGSFDGYILVLQSQGFWGGGHYDYVKEIIDYMIVNNKLDPFRVSDNGLSAGGQATWEMFFKYPSYIASAIPMSSVAIYYKDPPTPDLVKFTPFWNLHGGLDGSPAPSTADQVKTAMLAAGANYKNTLYPDLGHDTWNRTWNEPDFWPFMLRAYSSNPWPLFGRTEFCPSDPINVTIGLVAGFTSYEWRFNGTIIPGANSNTIQATQLGTYDARVLKGTLWSEWSPKPVVLKLKGTTIPPTVQVTGLASRVLPGLDGSTSVQLEVPAGYLSYEWQRVGNSTPLSTTRFLTVSTPGDYRVKIMEVFGCSSDFSNPFSVINANGPNKPDAAINLTATTISKTSIKLNWNDNPSPQFNETNFEIYKSLQPGGPYSFAGIVGQNVTTFVALGLNANTRYYFRVRAVNNTSASDPSNEANGTTQTDSQAPTAPYNLAITGSSRSTISFSWSPSTDDVAVTAYDIYVNGQKMYATTSTSFTISDLQSPTSYNITVRARDFAGNVSAHSNQVTGEALLGGLDYKYFVLNVTPNKLPDFTAMASQLSGTVPNVTLLPRNQENNIAFLFEGYINIPVAGTYTFNTNSDDGSRLYLGSLNGTGSPYTYAVSGNLKVDNDGNHGAQDAFSSALTLAQGTYPIAIAYYQGVGGLSLNISWRTPQTAGAFTLIPDSAFRDKFVVNGQPPAKPSNLVATAVSYKRIDLSWTRGSTNESYFELWRSINPLGNFSPIAQVPAGVLTYKDSSLTPNTKYYYRIRAINQYGESAFDRDGQGVDYSYYEQTNILTLPDFNSLTPIKTGRVTNFGLGMQNRGDNFAVKFTATLNLPTSDIYVFYTTSDDGSKLYIDGFDEAHKVVDNNGTHAAQERYGSKFLSAGAHTIYVTFFENVAGESLVVKMQGGGISKQTVPDIYLGTAYTGASTNPSPTAPLAPTNLVASAISKSAVTVNWTDVATNETRYELYRSANNHSNYLLHATLPANANSFTDEGLFTNAIYYYKVRAVGVNNSPYGTEDSAKTWNTPPVIVQLPASRTARFGNTTVITINASDADGDVLSFTGSGLPSFASLVDNGNKTATLTLNPSSGEQGVYNNLRITVSDPNGGSDFTQFNLTVNSNYDPVIGAVSNVSMNEGESLTIPLTASDLNGDNISWSVINVPNAFTLNASGNGTTGNLILNPGFGASGIYTIILSTNDGAGGYSTKQFNLTIVDKSPNFKVYIRVKHDVGNNIGLPWNTVTSANSTSFNDDIGNPTGVGLNFTGGYNSGNSGITTGNNSGVYPDAVLRDYFVFGAPWMSQTASAVLTGLNVSRNYTITLLGNSNWDIAPNNGSTNYTINGVTQSLAVQNNTQNTVTFNNIVPAADGTITIALSKGAGASAGYLNSIVVTALFNDGTVPIAPTTLAARYVFGTGVQLTWQDLAYNETGYEIYRSGSLAGPYNLIGTTTAINAVSYDDNTATGNTQYFYKIRAVNATGFSTYSNVASLTTPNRIPQLNPISDVILKTNQTLTVNITAVDDAADHITLSATNLPPFVTLTDNGNGTGSLSIVPNTSSVGEYKGILITAKDLSDSSRSVSFSISIIDKDVTSVYLNFSDGTIAGKPWNNLINPYTPGNVYTNLKDDSDAPTTMSVNMQDGFEYIVASGMRPRNGRELYPEVVMRSSLIETSTTAKRILVTGLSTSKRYNFVFFNSRDDGRTGTTNFTINGTTVTLNANYNIDKTVQINGIQPNASGQVTISVAKATGMDYAFLNAMIIQSYTPGTPALLGPTGLRAIDATRSTIKLQWQDRSNNETGFEIWRANDGGSSYAMVGTVGANVTTFTDGSLTNNRNYFYTVRARINTTTFSSYSNVTKANTYAYSVYVNFSENSNAGTPWNNTGMRPQTGFAWNSLRDENSALTSVGMVNTGVWSGLYGAGMTTGNNSGVYSDNVILESYGLFPGVSSTLRINGLNLGMKYNFTFFASSVSTGDVNVAYTVNGKTSLLNASRNTTGTLTMYDIVADSDGGVTITVAAGTITSEFGLIGALVIQGYTPSSNSGPLPSFAVQQLRVEEVLNEDNRSQEVKVYPNPFSESFTLAVPADNNEQVDVTIYDLGGKLVYQNRFSNLYKGINYLQVRTPASLKPGVYMVQTTFAGKKEFKLVKVIKQ